MYNALGYGKGNTILAVVAIVVGCPACVRTVACYVNASLFSPADRGCFGSMANGSGIQADTPAKAAAKAVYIPNLKAHSVCFCGTSRIASEGTINAYVLHRLKSHWPHERKICLEISLSVKLSSDDSVAEAGRGGDAAIA